MTPFNDALAYQQSTITCSICAEETITERIHWYGTPEHCEPVCSHCHAYPETWLQPNYSVPTWLANRDCERISS